MHVTIHLSDQNAHALEAQALAANTLPETYLREMVARALEGYQDGHPRHQGPKKSAYGLLAKYGPGPTEEEINENRREMFSALLTR